MVVLYLLFFLFVVFSVSLIGYVISLPLYVLLKRFNKNITNWIDSKLLTILLSLAIFFCVLSIFSIELEIIPKISTSWNDVFCYKLNNVFINLSYSFLAGYIFYIFTVVIPDYKKKKKITPILYKKISRCFRTVENIICKFSNKNYCWKDISREDLTNILDSKKWRDPIPNLRISYIEYISLQGKYLRQQVLETIDLYKDYMTESQIADLEYLIDMLIFQLANEFSSKPRVDIDNPQVKKSLINDFCNMFIKFQEIYKTFEINEKIYTK